MASLNRVLLIGNLTREPEQRNAGGSVVCMFGMAINRQFTNAHGEQKEETCFVDIEVWGRSAEVVMQYVHKGDPLFVEGRLNFDQWDDRETGKKRSRLTVRAERVQLLSTGRGPAPQQGFNGNGGYSQAPAGQQYGGGYAPQQAAPQYGYGQQQAPRQGGYAPRNAAPAQQNSYQPAPMPSFDDVPMDTQGMDNGPIADDDIPF